MHARACATKTNITVNAYFVLERKVRTIEYSYIGLCVIIWVYARKLNFKSVLHDYMCILTKYFTRSTNTQENGNVF